MPLEVLLCGSYFGASWVRMLTNVCAPAAEAMPSNTAAAKAAKLAGYFHFHGARGGLLLQLGRGKEAREAFDRAISLANTAAEAAHIRMHIDRLIAESEKAKRV